MSNLPDNPFGISSSETDPNNFHAGNSSNEESYLEQWVVALQNDNEREQALRFLVNCKKNYSVLGSLIWNSAGTIFVLLKDIVAVYGLLSTSNLTSHTATRVCNVLFLMHCVASNHTTKMQFIAAEIPSYIFPLISMEYNDLPHEYLRIGGLGVIGRLVEDDSLEAIEYLLKSQVFPNFLHCMVNGSELSKAAAIFIVHKILKTDVGLRYCCCIMDRFYAVTNVLEKMVERIVEKPSKHILKYIIACYQKLSEYPRARGGFRIWFPICINNEVIINILQDEPATMASLQQFFHNIGVELNH